MESLISPRFLWRVFPWLRPWLNRKAIGYFAGCTPPRPRTHSLWSHVKVPMGQAGPVADYTSWPGLTNRSFWSRHLPPAAEAAVAEPNDDPVDPANGKWGPVTSLFERPPGKMRADRSSALFMFFAQWFTDSLLRVDPDDRRKNRSNHDIDLCQIYGQTEEHARLLRSLVGGRLKSQLIRGEEYPEYLLEHRDGRLQVRPQFVGLIDPVALDKVLQDTPPERQDRLYATGLERGNSSIGYVSISTLFLREHNRICLELAKHHCGWDDERLFQTARMINTVLLIRILIEDYINHINGFPLFALDISFAEQKDWYRGNWMAVEFDLLYRWHALVPEAIGVKGQSYPADQFRNNNGLLEDLGVGAVLSAASAAQAGKIGMFNTPTFLLGAEFQAIKLGRDARLQSFNDYRQRFSLGRLTSFAQLTQDRVLQERLTQLYGNIERLELFVGLFAEDAEPGQLFGELMRNMVAYDAFTQILSNPLLARCVFTRETFSDYGYELIMETACLQDLVRRHFPAHVRASFSAEGRAVSPLVPRQVGPDERAAAE